MEIGDQTWTHEANLAKRMCSWFNNVTGQKRYDIYIYFQHTYLTIYI